MANYFQEEIETASREQIEKIQSDLQMPRRRSQILGLEDGERGWIRPEGESA